MMVQISVHRMAKRSLMVAVGRKKSFDIEAKDERC
jgi:hypothetical protein